MNVRELSAALMSVSLLIAVPAFAQSTAAQKQPTQEGGSSLSPLPCGLPYNADPSSDPNCKQRTQSLTPSSTQANFESAGKQK